jgi:hypothetical protein
MTQSCRTPLESIQVRALRFMLSYLEDRGETSGRAYAFVNEALNTLQSETGMPGNGNTPTTREGSAAAPGKAGTEARQSLGDKRQQSERKKITYERGILRDEAGLELTVDELVDYANRAWRAYEAADRQAMENGERALALLRAAPVGEERAFEDLLDDLEDVACRIEQSSGIRLGALMQERFDIRRQIHAARVTPSHVATNGQHDDVIEGLRVIASRRGCKIQQGDVLALERAIDALHHGGERSTVVEVIGHPDKPVSARCILSGCRDFTPSATAPRSDVYALVDAVATMFSKHPGEMTNWPEWDAVSLAFHKLPEAHVEIVAAESNAKVKP